MKFEKCPPLLTPASAITCWNFVSRSMTYIAKFWYPFNARFPILTSASAITCWNFAVRLLLTLLLFSFPVHQALSPSCFNLYFSTVALFSSPSMQAPLLPCPPAPCPPAPLPRCPAPPLPPCPPAPLLRCPAAPLLPAQSALDGEGGMSCYELL